MRHWTKSIIRRFAVWLKVSTDSWVISKNVWLLIDNEDIDKIEGALSEARKLWPDDPEVAYASAIVDIFTHCK